MACPISCVIARFTRSGPIIPNLCSSSLSRPAVPLNRLESNRVTRWSSIENAGLTGSPPWPRTSAFQSSAETSTNDQAPSNCRGYGAIACRNAEASLTQAVQSYFWLQRNWMLFGIDPPAGKWTAIILRLWACPRHAASRTANRRLFFTVVTSSVPPKVGAAFCYLNGSSLLSGQHQVTTQGIEKKRITLGLLSRRVGVKRKSRKSGRLPFIGTKRCTTPEESKTASTVRFGPFWLSPDTGELRKNGIRVRLFGQPIKVLTLLVATPGQVVTREQLQKSLWPGDTFGDFERGLNAAVNRLRENLGDSAIEPKYIETVPGRGYRFIGELEPGATPGPQPAELDAAAPTKSKGPRNLVIAATLGVAVVATATYSYFRRPAKLTENDTIIIADFDNKTGDAVFDDTLKTGMMVALNQSPFLN